MKAIYNVTGEIVDIEDMSIVTYKSSDGTYVKTLIKNFTFIDAEKDYYTKLEHQYAGMAMQGMIRRAYEAYCDDCANYENMIFEDAQALLKDHAEALADVCVEYAHALVEKLKEKEERK